MAGLERIRRWTQTTAGRVACAAVAVVGLGVLFVAARSYLGGSEAASASAGRTFVCAETGKPFGYTLVRGDTLPVRSLHSGRDTGYPAELCSWTADGRVRTDPVPVLLEEHKGGKGPTFCPDCGRRVVPHNPAAVAGAKPPPTRTEFARRPSRPAAADRD